MSTDREVTRIVRSWLEEGATSLPDRVLDAVLDQVPATPQRRPWRSARRYADVNNVLKVLTAAAAVVAVAFVGLSFLPRQDGAGGPGSSPSPASTPSASPVASLGVAIGALEPGTYRIDDPRLTTVPYTFTVPEGWTGRSDGEISKNSGQLDGVQFTPTVVTHVYTDACQSQGTLTPVGPTADDLVRALVDQADSDASTPVDTTVGGYPAKRIDMSVPADLDTSTCREPDVLIQIWADAAETSWFAIPVDPPGLVSPVYIVDADGTRVVLFAGGGPEASASDLAELQAVLDSITFEP